MTIEASLDRIAAALEKIASAAPSGAPAIPEPAAPVTESTRRGRGRPPKDTPPPAAEPEAPAAAPVDFLGGDEPEAALTLQDVRAALVALQKRTHAENARKVLKVHGGVDSLSSLPEDRFAKVIAAANAGK